MAQILQASLSVPQGSSARARCLEAACSGEGGGCKDFHNDRPALEPLLTFPLNGLPFDFTLVKLISYLGQAYPSMHST